MKKFKRGFAFETRSLQGYALSQIFSTIDSPTFIFELPPLSPEVWEPLLSPDAKERERLEFIGDALMHACIAVELYEMFPNGSPGLYTNARSSLVTNATFARLMAKLGIHDLRDEHKPAGDAFEMIVAGYFQEQGFQAVRDWVSKYYQPLIHAAKTACEDFWNTYGRKRKRDYYVDDSSFIMQRAARRTGIESSTGRPSRPRASSLPPANDLNRTRQFIDLTSDDSDMDLEDDEDYETATRPWLEAMLATSTPIRKIEPFSTPARNVTSSASQVILQSASKRAQNQLPCMPPLASSSNSFPVTPMRPGTTTNAKVSNYRYTPYESPMARPSLARLAFRYNTHQGPSSLANPITAPAPLGTPANPITID